MDNKRHQGQYPLLTSRDDGGGGEWGTECDKLFTMQNMQLITQKWPDINSGGASWIKRFLEAWAGSVPGIGDFRRVYCACTPWGDLAELEYTVGSTDVADDVLLERWFHALWPRIREKFPINMESSDLNNTPPREDKRGSAYLTRVRELWDTKIGVDPAVDRASWVMSVVVKSQSDDVRNELEFMVSGQIM